MNRLTFVLCLACALLIGCGIEDYLPPDMRCDAAEVFEQQCKAECNAGCELLADEICGEEGAAETPPKTLDALPAEQSGVDWITFWRKYRDALEATASPHDAIALLETHVSQLQLPEPWLVYAAGIFHHTGQVDQTLAPMPFRGVVDQIIGYLELELEEDEVLTDAEALEVAGYGMEQLGLLYRHSHPRFAAACLSWGHALRVSAFAAGEDWGPFRPRTERRDGDPGVSLPRR